MSKKHCCDKWNQPNIMMFQGAPDRMPECHCGKPAVSQSGACQECYTFDMKAYARRRFNVRVMPDTGEEGVKAFGDFTVLDKGEDHWGARFEVFGPYKRVNGKLEAEVIAECFSEKRAHQIASLLQQEVTRG